MKKFFLTVLITLSVFFASAEETLGVVDIYANSEVGFSRFHELVFSVGETVSDLLWASYVFRSTRIGCTFSLNSGLIISGEFLVVPTGIPHIFIDEDYEQYELVSFSEHYAQNFPSYEIALGTGWRFLIKNFSVFNTTAQLFITPEVRLRMQKYDFSAYGGYGFDMVTGKLRVHKPYFGWQITYSPKIFSIEILGTLSLKISDTITFSNKLGINCYFNAITYDYHVLRNIEFFDHYHFLGVMLIGESIFKYRLNSNMEFMFRTNYDFFYSSLGWLEAHFLNNKPDQQVKNYSIGVSGIKYLKFGLSVGLNFQVDIK